MTVTASMAYLSLVFYIILWDFVREVNILIHNIYDVSFPKNPTRSMDLLTVQTIKAKKKKKRIHT